MNQIFLTLDSLRYDVFKEANTPFLDTFQTSKAYTHATYTLPAHESFFVGKLPHSFDKGIFDTCARSNRKTQKQQWRLLNPESDGPAHHKLQGKNIIDGFNKKGYKTIGTGAVSWFDVRKPAHLKVVDDFQKFQFFGQYTFADQQISFVRKEIANANKPYFAFINFGETHHSFRISPNDTATDYGNTSKCYTAQMRCAHFLDNKIKELLTGLKNVEVIFCADHGECMGENGFWGHSFHHEKVLEVPIGYRRF
jgi:arylsulfatase A-like enzyme